MAYADEKLKLEPENVILSLFNQVPRSTFNSAVRILEANTRTASGEAVRNDGVVDLPDTAIYTLQLEIDLNATRVPFGDGEKITIPLRDYIRASAAAANASIDCALAVFTGFLTDVIKADIGEMVHRPRVDPAFVGVERAY